MSFICKFTIYQQKWNKYSTHMSVTQEIDIQIRFFLGQVKKFM